MTIPPAFACRSRLQFVPCPRYGENQFWPLGILLEFLTQAGDMDIYGACECAIFISPHLLQKLILGKGWPQDAP